ncbi:hypothetical protein J6590_083855 [Homalodisca vitripennis]|nr:hypothetical protein J6590_083855 [Homalodisca vitripennis]
MGLHGSTQDKQRGILCCGGVGGGGGGVGEPVVGLIATLAISGHSNESEVYFGPTNNSPSCNPQGPPPYHPQISNRFSTPSTCRATPVRYFSLLGVVLE